MMLASSRIPARTRWWWTVPSASRDGIGTRSSDSARSLRMSTVAPSACASSASRQIAPQRRGKPVDTLVDRPGRVERERADRRVRRAGDPLELLVAEDRVVEDELVRVLGGLGEQVSESPTLTSRLITICSRTESIGGFVTCA